MIYLIFLIVSCGYLYTLKSYKDCSYWTTIGYCLPVIMFWCLLIGGQYAVGIDYFAYLDMFNGGELSYLEEFKSEYLFTYFIKLCNSIAITGQGIFFIVALISVLLLFFIMKSIVSNKNIGIFFFVFIVSCGLFHNQMNILRQSLAAYITCSGCCCLINNNKKLGYFLIICSGLVHQSALIILPIIIAFMHLHTLLSPKILQVILWGSFLISILFSDSIIEHIVPYFKIYVHYMENGTVQSYSILNRLARYLYIPLYYISINKVDFMRLKPKKTLYFKLGIVGYSIMLAVSSLSLISRIGRYLELFACVPLVYLIIYYGHKNTKYTISLYLILPYLYKLISLYTYNSYFFNL